ncbi:hypothetical protein HGM15179_008451 [Zosterops borbonicus]|uniref:Uncharacterized protein n=1 Tax=Zosterops borbonicus TaxID=364589 RepID=A0A8K1GIG8_9PASS|nr:hypothetical protein HGM15179_008451 [Zosterops borbonicus]
MIIHMKQMEEVDAQRRFSSCGKPMLEQSVPERLCPVGGTHPGAREESEESSPEEERAAKTTCDELTTISIPCTCALQRKRIDRIVELSRGRREGQSEGAFKI